MTAAADDKFGPFRDLSDEIRMPLIGARFYAGVNSEGRRQSAFELHFDDDTVTVGEVIGLVVSSVFEWMHDVLHDPDATD